jgi:hypothetical protein
MYLQFLHADKTGKRSKDYTFLKNGDLVLRRGRSAESFAVYLFDKNRDYSHIGIVAVENGKPYIIHVVPDKPDQVRKDRPEVFLSPHFATHYKILRSDFGSAILNRVADNALVFYSRHCTFDNNYDFSTDASLYCTELVVKAFKKCDVLFPDIVPQKIKILNSGFDVIMPGSFLKNSHFTGIDAR